MDYPKYRIEGIIICRGGDVDGYQWVKNVPGIDDEDAKENYRYMEEEYRKRDRNAGAHIMVEHHFHRLVRIDKEEKTEIKVY